jgi:hypothetical protein
MSKKTFTINDLDKKLHPINDKFLKELRQKWYLGGHKIPTHKEFVDEADHWFKSTKLNNLQGWNAFPCVDVIMGCTHYIESLCSKHKWQIQVLPNEYAYYTVMGHAYTEIGNLKPNVPLIISLPNWKYGDIHPEWEKILLECEQKNIDIHIDCAWITVAKNFNFDFNHPNIKSFAMSMSKYSMTWNRIGLRWSRQRTMDSVTLISSQKKYQEAVAACGYFMMKNIDRDYGWKTYGSHHNEICNQLQLTSTNSVYIVKNINGDTFGLGSILSNILS